MSIPDRQNRIQETLRRLEEAHDEIVLSLNELRSIAAEESWDGDRHPSRRDHNPNH